MDGCCNNNLGRYVRDAAYVVSVPYEGRGWWLWVVARASVLSMAIDAGTVAHAQWIWSGIQSEQDTHTGTK